MSIIFDKVCGYENEKLIEIIKEMRKKRSRKVRQILFY